MEDGGCRMGDGGRRMWTAGFLTSIYVCPNRPPSSFSPPKGDGGEKEEGGAVGANVDTSKKTGCPHSSRLIFIINGYIYAEY